MSKKQIQIQTSLFDKEPVIFKPEKKSKTQIKEDVETLLQTFDFDNINEKNYKCTKCDGIGKKVILTDMYAIICNKCMQPLKHWNKPKKKAKKIIQDPILNKIEYSDITIDTTYNEKAQDTISRIKKNSIQMVLTSPPYDGMRKYEGLSFTEDDWKDIIKGCYRILQPGRVMVWVVDDEKVNGSKTGTSFKQALYAISIGFLLHDVMIYKTKSPSYPPTDDSNVYGDVIEYMFIFSKDESPKVVNLLKDRINLTAGNKNKSKAGVAGTYGIRFNIWEYSPGGSGTSSDKYASKHDAPFPETLAADHINSWSNEGETIYDPFGGAGTTGKVALLLKRHFIMSEISTKYIDTIINPRLDIVRNSLRI